MSKNDEDFELFQQALKDEHPEYYQENPGINIRLVGFCILFGLILCCILGWGLFFFNNSGW